MEQTIIEKYLESLREKTELSEEIITGLGSENRVVLSQQQSDEIQKYVFTDFIHDVIANCINYDTRSIRSNLSYDLDNQEWLDMLNNFVTPFLVTVYQDESKQKED